MRKLLKYSVFVLLLIVISCNESEDLLTDDAKEGGAIVTVGGSNGKVLGLPNLESGVISFTDNDLTFKVAVETGGKDVEGYSIVKIYNGGEEVVEAEFTKDQMPYTLSLTSLNEFLNGTGKASDDLRIGDVFSFNVKMKLTDGRVLYAAPSNGVYNVTVNCSSNLSGTYTVTGSGNGLTIGPRQEVISEISPGVYATQMAGHWGFECPIIFSDVCGTLTMDAQNLCNIYSNQLSGTGNVDPNTGDLHFEYSVTGNAAWSYVYDFVKN